MKFELDKKILKKLPTLKVGVLVVDKIKLGELSDGSFQYQCDIVDQLRKSIASEKIEPAFFEPSLVEWKKAFKKLGIDPESNKPAHIAIYDRIISGKDLPNINNLVNSTNAISLKYLVPVGAHDIDKIEGGVKIGQVDHDLDFKSNTKQYDPVKIGEEFAYMDHKEIITRHFVWRQSTKTMIGKETKQVFIPIDTLDLQDDEVEEIAKELITVLQYFLKSDEFYFGILSNQNVSLERSDLKEIKAEHEMNFPIKKIKKDEEIIQRILHKGVEEILPSEDDMESMLRSGRRLRVYQGFDPTAETLHIGHTVMMRKLEDFRELGHEVIMLIGDFTARIGDPTDKSAARHRLSKKEVKQNLRLYKDQAKAILDIENKENPVKVMFNNDWLGNLNFEEISEIASEFTVQQMIKRDMFKQRLKEDRPIHLHEFLYPLMQGWDSVSMNVDVEIGGNDQLFNMLAGRDLVRSFLGKEKMVIAGKLLTTVDGAKMGKSEGNMIKLSDHPKDIFGNVMAFPDQLIYEGYELLTNATLEELDGIKEELKGNDNPMELKKALAYRVTAELKGKDKAEDAQKYFEEVYQKGSFEADIEKMSLSAESTTIIELIATHGEFQLSKSQIRRLIEQGAVSLNGNKIKKWDQMISPEDKSILKVGRQVRMIEVH